MKESSGEFLEEYRDFNIFKNRNPIRPKLWPKPFEYWLEAWGDGVVLNEFNGKEMGFVEDAKVAIDEYWTYSMVNQKI